MKLRDFPRHSFNPSWKLVRVTEKTDVSVDEMDWTNRETGEILGTFIRPNSKGVLIDRQRYTKIYRECLEQMQCLSNAGMKMLTYIFNNLKDKSDTIDIDVSDCMDFCGYSSRTMFYKGLTDLINRGFLYIKTEETSIYFINVYFFYNGKRKPKEPQI